MNSAGSDDADNNDFAIPKTSLPPRPVGLPDLWRELIVIYGV
jgi:hypothetical protein